MKEANDSGELLSRVQELEDELKDSEQKRLDQIHTNMALQNKLKASQEEEGRICLEMANLKKKLVFGATSQVSRIEPGLEAPDKPPRVLCLDPWKYTLYFMGGAASPTPRYSHTHTRHPWPPPPEVIMEVKDKEPVSLTLQEEDVKFKLETENSDLRRKLDQQMTMYNHDMEVITQVCIADQLQV